MFVSQDDVEENIAPMWCIKWIRRDEVWMGICLKEVRLHGIFLEESQ